MGQRLASILTRYHVVLLILGGLLAAVTFPLSQRLRLDWQLDGMFAPGDPLVEAYERLQERFGGNEVVLAVYHDPGLWDESGEGLQRLEAVSDRLAEVEGVDAVLSLSELVRVLETLRGPMKLLNMGGQQVPPLLDSSDKLAQAFSGVFAGYTHQPDEPYVAVACMLEPLESDQLNHEETISALRSVMADLPGPAGGGLLAGEPVLVTDGFRMVQRDGQRLGITSTILVSCVLLICFRSIRWTLIPLIVVHSSLWLTQAALVLLDLDLTMVSSMLTAIVTVIGVATSMHLILRFQEQRQTGLDRHAALNATLGLLAAPIAWACLTDAAGFLSLMAADVGPVRDFGLMMAIGSMSVLFSILLLVPGLALIGPWDPDPRTPRIDNTIRRWLRRVMDFFLRFRGFGLLALLLIATFGLLGSLRMRVETDFTKNFEPESRIVQGYQVIESRLGGAGVWDVMLPAPASISAEYLEQVVLLEEQLRQLRVPVDIDAEAEGSGALTATDSSAEESSAAAETGSVSATSDEATPPAEVADQAVAPTSPAALTDSIRLTKVLSMADAELASRSGPLLSALPISARLEGMRRAMPKFSEALLTPETDQAGNRWLRIMLRSREQAPAEAKLALVTAVENTVQQFTDREQWKQLFSDAEVSGGSAAGEPPRGDSANVRLRAAPDQTTVVRQAPRAEVTGYHVMLGRLVSSVLADQWKCFGIATAAIFAFMFLATRSLGLAVSALIPNALPILVVLGTMGWFEIRVNIGAAMIAAVSMGLSIDSSIHYLIHFRRRLEFDAIPLEALRSAQENVGLAVVLSTIALIVGFLSLVGSEFVPTVVFGTLVSLTMLGGVLGNLIVLPLLIAPKAQRRYF